MGVSTNTTDITGIIGQVRYLEDQIKISNPVGEIVWLEPLEKVVIHPYNPHLLLRKCKVMYNNSVFRMWREGLLMKYTSNPTA